MSLRVGVIGTGQLGQHHVRVLSELSPDRPVLCFDTDAKRASAIATEHGATVASSLEDLLANVDAVSIVVPTTYHLPVAQAAMEFGCDVFVEKPIAASVAEAEQLIKLAAQHGRVLQVGHVERFNGAFEKAVSQLEAPAFIEIHRLAPFSVRGTDVSVVGDLMIHDLDLLHVLVGETPTEVHAKGAAVLTKSPDIVNARLAFPGGCVANVTTSRISMEKMRKVRIFSQNQYASIDLLGGKAALYRKKALFDETVGRLREDPPLDGSFSLTDIVEVQWLASDGGEPLVKELQSFLTSVENRSTPVVTGEDGLHAVELATRILASIRSQG